MVADNNDFYTLHLRAFDQFCQAIEKLSMQTEITA